MRRLLLLCFIIPVIGMSQTKNIFSVQKIFAKVDKVLEFEKALGAHSQKYHTGDAKWRVYEISSGPDAGGYQIVEGPFNWTGLDARGNLGTDHTLDYNKNVAPYATQDYQSGYYEYQESLSTVAIGEFSNKIRIVHWFPKPGRVMAVRQLITKMKKVWEADNVSVAVYMAVSSGQAQFALVTRYKNGFKDMDVVNPINYKDRYEKVNGPDSFDEYYNVLQNFIEKSWGELLELRPELGSK